MRPSTRWSALLLSTLLAACAPATNEEPDGVVSDDDDSTPEEELNLCHGDALVDNAPISDDLDALQQRFDTNDDLVRIMFLGEPF